MRRDAVDVAAVGEPRPHAPAVVGDADALAAGVDEARRQGRQQPAVQVGPVDDETRRAPAGAAASDMGINCSTRPADVQNCPVTNGRASGPDDVPQPQRVEHADGVGQQSQAGPDLAEDGCPLVDGDRHRRPAAARPGRQPADAGTDDEDGAVDGIGGGLGHVAHGRVRPRPHQRRGTGTNAPPHAFTLVATPTAGRARSSRQRSGSCPPSYSR